MHAVPSRCVRSLPPCRQRPSPPFPSSFSTPFSSSASVGAAAGDPPTATTLRPRFDYKGLEAQLPLHILNAQERNDTGANPKLVLELWKKKVTKEKELNILRAERTSVANEMKRAKEMGDEERLALIGKGKVLRQQLSDGDVVLRDLESELLMEASHLPNLSHPSSPVVDEVVVEEHGDIPLAAAVPLSHEELGKKWDLMDFERAAEVSGGMFYFLKNDVAILEGALVSWAMNLVRQKGFTPIVTPDLVRTEYINGTGFNPRSEANQTYTLEGENLHLIATSEIPLAAYHSQTIFSKERGTIELPSKMVAHSHCFRPETTHRGRMSRGLYRVHQFTKVEMFVVCHPEQGDAIFEELVTIEKEILQTLGLPFRVLEMPRHELGASAHRKVDMEVWFPSREAYGEVSSASHCLDYQARRLDIRFKEENAEKTEFAHTLNATALATPRIIMAILENYQQPDGSIRIPEALVPYMGNQVQIPAPMPEESGSEE